MFFKIQSIKQLMTAAYKGEGLTVGRDAYSETDKVGYYIHGHGWTVWNSEACMPNVLKAAIVEFCGSLPEYASRQDEIRSCRNMGDHSCAHRPGA